MRWFGGFCAVLVAVPWLVSSASAVDEPKQALEATDPDLGGRIIQAESFDDRLWLLGAARDSKHHNGYALASFSLPDGERKLSYSDGVLSIHKMDNQLWVLRSRSAAKNEYALLKWGGSDWSNVAEFRLEENDTPLALTAVDSKPCIISQRAVRIYNSGTWQVIHLKGRMDDGFGWGVAVAAAPSTGDWLYIGFDRGEWGGGLRRIDLGAGTVEDLESSAKSDTWTHSVLSSGVDPVNGIVADPQNPSCVIAAVGLVHMMSSGRILRICDRRISVVYEHLVPEEVNGNKFNVSEAFFGLVSAGKGYWAVGNNGVYHFAGTDQPQHYDLPQLISWHGLHVNRDLPDILILTTDMNASFSVSGYTPLIVYLGDSAAN